MKYVRYGFQNGEKKIIREKKKRSETKTRVVRVEMSRMILVKKTVLTLLYQSRFDPLTPTHMCSVTIYYIRVLG